MRSALSVSLVALLVVAGIAILPAAAVGDAAQHTALATDTAEPAPAPVRHTASITAEPAPAPATDTASDRARRGTQSSQDACEAAAPDPPEDPETDLLGWENGCWANETLSITRKDGLNETELDAVVARSMARVEAVRGQEFERAVPVEVIARDEYRDRRDTSNSDTDASTANRLHQNVKWEAMLSVGEDTDAISTLSTTRTQIIGGFYDYQQDRIVIVSENTTTPKMDEITLSQELFHALQDQQFEVSYNRSTREGYNAGLGIIEGDGNLVDRRYQQRCEAAWDCLSPEDEPGGGDSSDLNYGIYLTQFQPYSDGPKFVKGIYDEGGWGAVNAVYENPPASTEQVIHPEKYPDEGPVSISFTDTSSDEWRIPDTGAGGVKYARFGEAGLAAMMMRPVFASGGTAAPVVGPRDFYNFTADGEVSDFQPLFYSLEATDGWGNDRLYPYITDDSATTNETGYVWKTVWDEVGDAGDFADGYAQLLDYYGADVAADSQSVYRIPGDSQFGDAFYVEQDGESVVIVNAPTVAALGDIRAGAGQVRMATATETPQPTDATLTTTEPGEATNTEATTRTMTERATPTATDAPTPRETTAADGPGFDGFVTLIAVGLVVAALGVAGKRRTDQ
jgi:hypothetical protein